MTHPDPHGTAPARQPVTIRDELLHCARLCTVFFTLVVTLAITAGYGGFPTGLGCTTLASLPLAYWLRGDIPAPLRRALPLLYGALGLTLLWAS